jgi:hypothetical protein
MPKLLMGSPFSYIAINSLAGRLGFKIEPLAWNRLEPERSIGVGRSGIGYGDNSSAGTVLIQVGGAAVLGNYSIGGASSYGGNLCSSIFGSLTTFEEISLGVAANNAKLRVKMRRVSTSWIVVAAVSFIIFLILKIP